MKMNVGDRVRFLNDIGEGVVKKILEKGIIMVENSDGFEIPYPERELVPVSGSYEKENKVSAPKEKPAPRKIKAPAPVTSHLQLTDDEIVLAFVASSKSPELNLYLVNSSSWQMYFTISVSTGKIRKLLGKGHLEEGLKVYLGKYLPSDLDSMVNLNIQALLFKEGEFTQKAPLHISRSIPAENLFDGNQRSKSAYFDEPALLLYLETFGRAADNAGFVDPEKLRDSMLSRKEAPAPQEKQARNTQGVTEIDLHIENLTDKHAELSPAEILDIQLSKFRIALDSAILNKSGRIVFIHGVGNGKLRYELRKALDQEYKGLKYQDASFKEYGYGATLVYLK